MINNIIQLKLYNINDKYILKKQKLDYKYKIKKILLNNKIFIIDYTLDLMMN